MRTLLGVPIVAVLLAAVTVNTGYASCCGAASYKHLGCCDPASYGAAKQQCYTVMKTCREGRVREADIHLLQDLLRDGLRARRRSTA